MNLHPEIVKILDGKMNCPACSSKLQEFSWAIECENKLCADFKILDFATKDYCAIAFKSAIGRDNMVMLIQHFIKDEISLIIHPQLKELIIPSFPIDFKNLDKLPNKLKLYVTLS